MEMETPGAPDAGSDASYESVASEGGFEPAADRGRDPVPRIVSASHCVEVFRRVRWQDGMYCSRAPAPDDQTKGAKGKKKTTPLRGHDESGRHDPLAELPRLLMRFDGAMEAWLEELPMPRDPRRLPRPYTTLNDAGSRSSPSQAELLPLRAGNRNATIWYFTLEFLQQLWPLFLSPDGAGMKLWEHALLSRGCTIQSTHIAVGQVHCPQQNSKTRASWLKALFQAMQGSKWTPDGEARTLLAKRRLTHASMSIGDAVQIGAELYVVGLGGFIEIKEATVLLPPNFDLEQPGDENDLESDGDVKDDLWDDELELEELEMEKEIVEKEVSELSSPIATPAKPSNNQWKKNRKKGR